MSKTKKTRKLRGKKTGYGAKKKHRGAGSRGGRGLAGLHKYKWTWTVTHDPYHFKKPSLKPKPKVLSVINLGEINEMAIKKGLNEIELSGYKVLGEGEMTKPLTIKAELFSKSANEKIEKAGGKAIAAIENTQKKQIK